MLIILVKSLMSFEKTEIDSCFRLFVGMKVNALDLSPNFAGTLMGITNGIGALTGIAAVS